MNAMLTRLAWLEEFVKITASLIERSWYFMTNLDWLLSDEERSKGALSDLNLFIEQYNINDWWCECKCPVNDLCEPDEDFPDIRACLYEYGRDKIKMITDWFNAEHND